MKANIKSSDMKAFLSSKVKLSADSASAVHLVECPRDAMQGLAPFIPTADKIRYLNALLRVGSWLTD